MTTVDCAAFDEDAADLALGFAPEPRRSALLAHAADCTRCSATLAELGRTVDALVELAPEAEPPAGFESRAVAAMGPVPASPPNRRRLWLAAAAVVLVIAGLVGVATVTGDERTRASDPTALIRSADGEVLGRVELASSPSPRVVVVVDDHDWRGTWVCELRRADGTWVAVGRWTAEDAPTGAWSAAVDHDLLDATAMRITAGDGFVVATSDRLDSD